MVKPSRPMRIYMLRVRADKLNPAAVSKYRWKWQLVHGNGTVIATSILYTNRQTADASLTKVRAECGAAMLETIMEV